MQEEESMTGRNQFTVRAKAGRRSQRVSMYRQREARRSMFDLASFTAVPRLPQSMLTTQTHLVLPGYESATGMTALSHNLPLSFLLIVPKRRWTKLWLLLQN